jgi:phage portal protein BeeE
MHGLHHCVLRARACWVSLRKAPHCELRRRRTRREESLALMCRRTTESYRWASTSLGLLLAVAALWFSKLVLCACVVVSAALKLRCSTFATKRIRTRPRRKHQKSARICDRPPYGAGIMHTSRGTLGC